MTPPLPIFMEEIDYTRGGVIHEKLEAGGPWGGVILTRDRPRPPLYSDRGTINPDYGCHCSYRLYSLWKTTMTSGQDVSEYLDTLGLVKSYFLKFFEKKKLEKSRGKKSWFSDTPSFISFLYSKTL